MENEKRKLVSIQRIRKVIKHPNADRLDVCTINDWTVVSKIGEFKEGDLCCFFEIDSFLPDTPIFNFLGTPKTHKGVVGHRLKTSKIRNIISQGLALPLSSFPELNADMEGDLSSKINVIKYDPEFYTDNSKSSSPKTGNPAGKFPSFIPKTDQERIQNLPHYYELYKDHLWEETLKLDGSSLTAYKIHRPLSLFQKIKQFFGFKQKDYHFGVCSRNLELKPNNNFKKEFLNGNKPSEYSQSDFWKIMIELNVEDYLPAGYAIQGELIGPKIQNNHEKVDHNQFYLFDIYDIKNHRYLTPHERQLMMPFLPTIKHVPIVSSSSNIFQRCTNLSLLQQQVTGESMNPGTVSEGRVFKSCSIPGLSFKCISNEYLLKAD